jgi:DNA-binding MurR/RpiR family transcriptional regulator
LAFTDGLQSPLARNADLALPIPGKNLLFSHSLAAFGTLAHALATALAREHPQEALKTMRETEKVASIKFAR